MGTISGTSSLYSSSLTNGTYTSNFTSGNFTVYATSSKNVTVPKVSTQTVNGKSISLSLNLGGAGNAGSYRCVGFTTSGAATITVYAIGASGRSLALVDSTGTTVSSKETSSSLTAYTFTASSAGTYYIQSLASAISLYYIKVAVGSTSTSTSSSTSISSSSVTMYPAASASNVYEDVELKLTFSSTPSIGSGSVKIYSSDGTLVDTIKSSDEILDCNTLTKTYTQIAVGSQMIYVLDNSVIIKPHAASDGQSSILKAGTTYYVQIASGLITVNGSAYSITDKSWTFTVRSTPSFSSPISVGKNGTESFYTIQGAFNYLMSNSKTDDWTINVSSGKYYEFLHFNKAKTPNVTIIGDSSDIPQIHWKNAQPMKSSDGTVLNSNGGVRTRSTFLWQGGNLTLKYLKFFNDYDITNGGDLQAETLAFDKSKARLAAFKCKFSSYQDTLYIGSNAKAWFYNCEVVGDVDTIWGYASVALFEKCTFSIAAMSNDPGTSSYQFESRIGYNNMSGIVGKGFVALNCTIKAGDTTETYYFGRRANSDTSTYYDQMAIINPTFQSGSVNSAIFYTGYAFGGLVSGSQVLIGANSYGISGASTNTSKFIGVLSDSVYKAEYSSRSVILNRGINASTKAYVNTDDNWDYSSIESDFTSSSSSSTSSSTNSSSSSSGTKTYKETPSGFAGYGCGSDFGSKEVTVSTSSDFRKYATAGGYIIYVNGMIDLSDGMLPTSAGGTTTVLDSFVKTNTSSKYSNYTSFRDAYVKGCSTSTDDSNKKSPSSTLGTTLWALSEKYSDSVCVEVASKTTIIGLTSSSGIKGGSLWIGSSNNTVSNVIIRNMTIQDAYDPFPWHEGSDGYNASWDCINVFRGKYIWVDHCTLKDTMHYIQVKTGGSTSEKFQTYDGLCDIKRDSIVTVSYCKFYNHDKTMLIGNADNETLGGTGVRNVTLHHNYYLDCGQRLPFCRKTNLHIYNNYYDTDSNAEYSQLCAFQPRYQSLSVVEGCYFGSGIKYSLRGDASVSKLSGVSSTKVYLDGNTDKSSNGYYGSDYFTVVTTKPITIPYTYTVDSASNVKTNLPSQAGAGIMTIVR